MPITYRFESNALAIFRLTGTVPDGAVIEITNRFLSDERVRPGIRILSDHRELQNVITTDGLHDIQERIRSDIERLEGARISAAIFSNQTAAGDGGWFEIKSLKRWSVHVTDITAGDVVTVSVSLAASQPGDSDDEITHSSVTADGIIAEPDNTYKYIKIHKSDGSGGGNTDAVFNGWKR